MVRPLELDELGERFSARSNRGAAEVLRPNWGLSSERDISVGYR